METPEFPPNSEVSKRGIEEKNIKQVTSGEVVRRKRSLRKQFKEVFIAGDLRSSVTHALFEIMLPSAKDVLLDATQAGLEKLFFGESRRRGPTTPYSGPSGVVNYRQYSHQMGSRLSSSQRVLSRRGRAQHNFDEILLENRTEAEEVIDRLFDLVSRYGTATVADLYELVGLPSAHTDHKWGWTDLRGAGVSRTRNGYLLDLPEPHPLDGA